MTVESLSDEELADWLESHKTGHDFLWEDRDRLFHTITTARRERDAYADNMVHCQERAEDAEARRDKAVAQVAGIINNAVTYNRENEEIECSLCHQSAIADGSTSGPDETGSWHRDSCPMRNPSDAAQAMLQELDDYKADYLRRHNDALDWMEKAKTALARAEAAEARLTELLEHMRATWAMPIEAEMHPDYGKIGCRYCDAVPVNSPNDEVVHTAICPIKDSRDSLHKVGEA